MLLLFTAAPHIQGQGMEYCEKRMFETRYWGGEKKPDFETRFQLPAWEARELLFHFLSIIDRFIRNYQHVVIARRNLRCEISHTTRHYINTSVYI